MLKSRSKKWLSILMSAVMVISMFFVCSKSIEVDAAAATLFSDNFEDGNANGWNEMTGSWSVVTSGSSKVYQQSNASTEGRTAIGSNQWKDYYVEAKVKANTFNNGSRIQICGRFTDANNYYSASLYNSSNGTIEIRKKVNGSSSNLASKKYPFTTGTIYTIKLEMNGSTIKMYVNGTLQLSATDSTLSTGAMGIVSKAAAEFDDISVVDPSGASASPTPTATPDPSTSTPTPNPTPTPPTPTPPTSTPTPPVIQTPTPPSSELSEYNLEGFAYGNTGGGVIPETDSAYRKVSTPEELVNTLYEASKNGTVRVIEITNDLNMGWNEVPASARKSPLNQGKSALTNPILMKTGISKLYIQDINNLTIFSSNGATIKHVGIDIRRCSNIIMRNLNFDEMWEWDESTKGEYDRNDWDYLCIRGASSKVWIDHCTFNKSYDGLVDMKEGANGITISWCTVKGDDRSADSWVTKQINYLEANMSSYPMYSFIRNTLGLSKDDVIAISASQKKGHLVGSNKFESDNAKLQVTLHDNYYKDMQDRFPRLRAGNAHVYNVVMDSADAYKAMKKVTPEMEAQLLSKQYKFGVTSNGSISTEGGAVLVEKCNIIDIMYPLRNNQVDPRKPEYTGKIKAVDTMYSLDGVSFRGDSDTAGSPLTPVPATPLAFSWNGFTSLPYSYTPDDPSVLLAKLTGTNGTGAGKLTWDKVNWLKVSY